MSDLDLGDSSSLQRLNQDGGHDLDAQPNRNNDDSGLHGDPALTMAIASVMRAHLSSSDLEEQMSTDEVKDVSAEFLEFIRELESELDHGPMSILCYVSFLTDPGSLAYSVLENKLQNVTPPPPPPSSPQFCRCKI